MYTRQPHAQKTRGEPHSEREGSHKIDMTLWFRAWEISQNQYCANSTVLVGIRFRLTKTIDVTNPASQSLTCEQACQSPWTGQGQGPMPCQRYFQRGCSANDVMPSEDVGSLPTSEVGRGSWEGVGYVKGGLNVEPERKTSAGKSDWGLPSLALQACHPHLASSEKTPVLRNSPECR
jgi:hypothetical protein